LNYSLLPCTTLPKKLFEEIKYLLQKYAEMDDDKINLAERWGSLNGAGSCGGTASQSVKKLPPGASDQPFSGRVQTKEDKLLKCIRGLLDKNLKEGAPSNA